MRRSGNSPPWTIVAESALAGMVIGGPGSGIDTALEWSGVLDSHGLILFPVPFSTPAPESES